MIARQVLYDVSLPFSYLSVGVFYFYPRPVSDCYPSTYGDLCLWIMSGNLLPLF
jgi:hypothetical protein